MSANGRKAGQTPRRRGAYRHERPGKAGAAPTRLNAPIPNDIPPCRCSWLGPLTQCWDLSRACSSLCARKRIGDERAHANRDLTLNTRINTSEHTHTQTHPCNKNKTTIVVGARAGLFRACKTFTSTKILNIKLNIKCFLFTYYDIS